MTDWPTGELVAEVVTTVAVAAAVTVWVTVTVEVAKLASPEYTALIEWAPPVIDVPGSAQAALPTPGVAVVATGRAHSVVAPSLKVRVPVGVVVTPLPAVTVAV